MGCPKISGNVSITCFMDKHEKSNSENRKFNNLVRKDILEYK